LGFLLFLFYCFGLSFIFVLLFWAFFYFCFIVLGFLLFTSPVNSSSNCVQFIEKHVMEFEWDQNSASHLG
jgi:hypothetical protein